VNGKNPEVLGHAQGIGGSVTVYSSKIVISHRGLVGGFRGEKDVPFGSITSVALKKPGLTNGYIKFGVVGAQERQGGAWTAKSDANSVMFNAFQTNRFISVKDLIERLQAGARGSTQTTPSVADEIRQLAKLRDEGLLTEGEYQARKSKLLES
jgi:hypothetical protein